MVEAEKAVPVKVTEVAWPTESTGPASITGDGSVAITMVSRRIQPEEFVVTVYDPAVETAIVWVVSPVLHAYDCFPAPASHVFGVPEHVVASGPMYKSA
jgi:hypothetical protein